MFTFRIWFPFAILSGIIVLIIAFYYSSRQEDLYIKNRRFELQEIAKSVALAVELSLEHENLEGLQRALALAKSTDDFEKVALVINDSIGKKIKVVEAIASAIGLDNVTAEHTRAEAIKNRKFDVVVSRAVAPLKELWQWSKPLLKRNPADANASLASGLICLKGGDLAKEIAESGCRPRMTDIHELFPEPYFQEKYILQVKN